MKLMFVILTLLSQSVYSSEFLTTDVKSLLKKISGHASFGDLNGDGYNDIFTSEIYSYYQYCTTVPSFIRPIIIDEPAKVYINNQLGGFYISEQAFMPSNLDVEKPCWVDRLKYYRTTIADVNNDGANDIVTSDGRIFINNGNAEFINQVNVDIGFGRESIKAIDFNNDGVLEIFNDGKSDGEQILIL